MTIEIKKTIRITDCCDCPHSSWTSLGDNWVYCKILKTAKKCTNSIPSDCPLKEKEP